MRTQVVLALIGFAAAAACSGAATPTGFGGNGNGSGSGGSSGSGSGGSGSGGGNGSGSGGISLGGGSGGSGSGGGTADDAGFVCAPNPLNYDILGNGCDDDGDGQIDNVITCDTSVPTGPGASTATQILNAMEVCHAADATHWGIVSAVLQYGYTSTGPGDGNFTDQYGVLQTYGTGGVKAQEGAAFGLLSSGTADINDTDDNGPYFKGNKNGMQNSTQGDVPKGFPQKTSNGCVPASDVHDVVNLKVQIKVPANAKGVSFDFNFYSGEWPEYVCSSFNDSFIAFLTSTAFNGGTPGNISFDAKGNPVGVNIGFFSVCSPAPAVTGCDGTVGSATCTAGSGALAGTGFLDTGTYCNTDGTPNLGLGGGNGQTASGGGSTGWLTSTAPVNPGETITLDFIIWDTGDPQYDSSVLLDYLTWQGIEVPGTPVTQPSPPPK